MKFSLSDCFLLVGAIFIFIAALGLVRMPDLFLRMHASAKAGTLGAGLLLTGAVIYFATWSVATEIIIAILFLIMTAPVAFHLIGRAAYRKGIKLHPLTRNESQDFQ
ncbi:MULTISPECIES: monovalent cation/H(+) antiporter subunit G [unclassified Legionella]|uniref:monovalent cation/H(+) antiporter subunit G n=1 Tax=unclassified Legionella TaxID=2622702 RepID=UPI001056875D|nr:MULTISPECIES: monovalent cation/H(+) antiporter subunit G [unclassified Legionella]MDI9819419.1 monovalent cation/H(+) antiporter subunit G [Legionella sp. PL877]